MSQSSVLTPYRMDSWLVSCARPFEAVGQPVDSRSHQQALVRLDEPAGDPVYEAGTAFPPDRVAGMVPVAVEARRRYARFDVGTAQRRILSEVPLHVPTLEDELMAIRNMLPLAPGTRPEVLARRGNAMGRRRDDILHYARDHPLPTPTVSNDSRYNTLAGNSPEHVDSPVLEVGKTVAKRAYLVEEGQLSKFRGLIVGPYGGHLTDCSRGTQGIRAFPLVARFPLRRRI